jgi:Tfp pilus assembly protein PilZ
MKEKRTSARFGPLVVKTAFLVGSERRQGYLTNVSLGGAFLAVDDPPPPGADVEIRASLPWRLGELRCAARVAWRSGGGGQGASRLEGVGLAFHPLSPEATRLLETYLERFTDLAARIEEQG